MNTKRKILAVALLASLTVGLVGLLSSCGLIFKPITYTVSYKYCVEPLCRGGDCEHEKWEMGTYDFTVKDGVLGTPSLPNKFGYNSTWRGVELTAGDKEVYAEFTPIEYEAEFVAWGGVIDTQKYTVEGLSQKAPEIPDFLDFKGEWPEIDFSSKEGKLTLHALYSSKDATDGLLYQSLNNGTCSVVGYEGDSSNVVIPHYYRNEIVVGIESGAFFDKFNVASITLPESLEYINSYAFVDCFKLVEVTNLSPLNISAGSSANGGVAENALHVFNRESVETNVINENGFMFIYQGGDCYLIGYDGEQTNLVLPDSIHGNPYSIYQFGLSGMKKIESVVIPSSVLYVGENAFYNCTSLKKVEVECLEVDYSAFEGCYALTEIKADIDVLSVFHSLANIESVTLFGLGSVPSGIFSGNESLKKVVLEYGITGIDANAFEGCVNLLSVSLPSTLSNIGSNAFNDCEKLVEVFNFTGFNIQYGVSLNGKVGLNALIIHTEEEDSAITKRGDYTFCEGRNGLYLIEYNGSVENLEISLPSGDYEIYRYAFRNYGFTKVTIPYGVTAIGKYAFANCYALNNLIIPDSVSRIEENAFDGCPLSATNENGVLYVNNWVVGSIAGENPIIKNSAIGICNNAFYGREDIYRITIPASVKYISDGSFTDCYNLVEVYNLSRIDVTAGDTNNGGVAECAKVVHTSPSATSIVKTYGNYIFCVPSIGEAMLLKYNGSETDVTLPDSSVYGTYSIATRAFTNTQIQSVTIPKSTVTAINRRAFCDLSLEAINIPSSVLSIDMYAFEGSFGVVYVEEGYNSSNWGEWDSYVGRVVYNAKATTCSFDSRGGTSVGSISAVFITNLPAPTKDGVTFLGWYTTERFTVAVTKYYYFGVNNVTLYAKWSNDASAPDDLDWAQTVSLGGTYLVSVDNLGDVFYFAFTPTYSGRFTFYTTGSYDTVGTLYTEEMNSELAYNDDARDSNFEISYDCTAGVRYIIEVKMFSSSQTGTFNFHVV